MTDTIILAALVLAASACWLAAGVFGAFSDFLMRSFAAMQVEAGIAAMQSINRVIYRSAFVVALMGLVPVSAAVAIAGLVYWNADGSAFAAIGAMIYLLGVMGTTGMGNIPMNERLDGLDAGSAEAADYWQVYLRRWTRLNHVRSLSCTAAAVCLSCAVVLRW